MKPTVALYRLGRKPYYEALSIQQALFEKLRQKVSGISRVHLQESCKHSIQHETNKNRAKDILTSSNSVPSFNSLRFNCVENSLLLVEHEPVYTFGIRSKGYDYNYVEKLKIKLAEHGLEADCIETNRGGLITFHGPGQLVAYPIIYLGDFSKIHNKSVKSYVSLLETTVIDTLSMIGIDGAHTVKEHPGVWLDNGERKVAFIGISCKRYVTMHGISLNCDCDLTWFDHIVSCGIEDKLITSIKKELLISSDNHTDLEAHSRSKNMKRFYDSDYSVDNVSKAFCLSFCKNFNCTLREE